MLERKFDSDQLIEIDQLITEQGALLSSKLDRHRYEIFPPKAQKTLRSFQLTEVANLVGISQSHLRNLVQENKGPSPSVSGTGRKSFTGEQILELRQFLNNNGRSKQTFVPHRKEGDHLQIIAVTNFKGGSGKTTTSAHLAQHLALSGHRVLAIDLDPQASLSALHGFQPEIDVQPNETLYAALRYDDQKRPIAELIKNTNFPGLDIIPGNLELVEFEYDTPRILAENKGFQKDIFFTRLDSSISEIDHLYDVVIIDCPPQLGYLSMAAICASTSLLVTVHPQMLDVMSMSQFLIMMGDIMSHLKKAGGNMRLDWLRYLITRYEPTDMPQTEMVTFLRSLFGKHILTNPMLKSVAISDAGITKQTLYEIEKQTFTRSTYDRAMESLNLVNGEIQNLIHKAWGRTQ